MHYDEDEDEGVRAAEVMVKSKSRSDRTRLEGLNEVTARDTTWTRRVRLFQANDTRGGATHFGPSAAMMMVKSKAWTHVEGWALTSA